MQRTKKWFPRGGRFGGTLLAALIAVIAVLTVAGALALTSRKSEREELSGAEASADHRDEAGSQLCAIEHVRCASVPTTGAAVVEYAVLPGRQKTDPGLVLAELGGPGIDLFTRSGIESLGLPEAASQYDILLIREPWAGHRWPHHCMTRLNDFGVAIADGRADAPPIVDAKCAMPAWTDASYRAALTAVLRAERRPLVGIVGQSFGALLAVAAAQVSPTAWLLLHAPIAPPDTPGEALLTQRAGALSRALDASYASHCKALGLDCRTAGSRLLDEAMSRVKAKTVDGRTNAITSGDVSVAAIAAAYDLQANQGWLWRTLAALPDVADRDWVTIGRLADQLLQRSDSRLISPKLAAYLAGMCASYTRWSVAPNLLPVFFQALSQQCQHSQPATAGWSRSSLATSNRRAPVCIIINEQDTVVDPVAAGGWARRLPNSVTMHYHYRGHISLAQAMKAVKAACGILAT